MGGGGGWRGGNCSILLQFYFLVLSCCSLTLERRRRRNRRSRPSLLLAEDSGPRALRTPIPTTSPSTRPRRTRTRTPRLSRSVTILMGHCAHPVALCMAMILRGAGWAGLERGRGGERFASGRTRQARHRREDPAGRRLGEGVGGVGLRGFVALATRPFLAPGSCLCGPVVCARMWWSLCH